MARALPYHGTSIALTWNEGLVSYATEVQSQGFEERCACYAQKEAWHSSLRQIQPESKESEASDRDRIIGGAAQRRQSPVKKDRALCFEQALKRGPQEPPHFPESFFLFEIARQIQPFAVATQGKLALT
jgi:hypothetical protein